jgi:anti-anti-sigma factor
MTTDELSSTVRRRGEVVVVDLVGDIDRGAESALTRAWDEAVRGQPAAVVLNFSGAGYINSTGIALIVGVLARARAAGIPLRAYGLTQHYREIFEITRLADYLAITTDEDSAVGGADRSTT